MPKQRRVWSNVLILLGVFVVGGALVVIGPLLRKTEPVLPPEPADLVAKRMAPENAFFPLVEALALLPNRPSSLNVPDKDDPRLSRNYEPKQGSLGWMTTLKRPDDDQELLEYIKACEPAFAKAREALQRPYFLLPIDWANPGASGGEKDPREPLGRLTFLGGAYAARSILALRGGDEAAAADYAVDCARLSVLLSGEKAMVSLLWPFPVCIREIACRASDATVERVANEIGRLRDGIGSNKEILALFLREIDWSASHFWDEIPNASGGIWLKRSVFLFRARNMRKWIAANRETLFSFVDKPFSETRQWAEGITGGKTQSDLGKTAGFLGSRVLGAIGSVQDVRRFISDNVLQINASKARYVCLLDGSALIVALERFRRAEGAYPEKLDSLAPKYIKTIPKDPFSGEALVYARDGEDYRLHSVGVDLRDNGGAAIPEGRNRARGDDVVIHWPAVAPN